MNNKHNHIRVREWRPEQFSPSYYSAIERYHRCNTEEGRGCDDCRGLSDGHKIIEKMACACLEGEAQLTE